MLFPETLVLLRGGGDLATGVAYRLHQAGFPMVVFELARPLVVRRRVALATAVLEGEIRVEGVHGICVESFYEALRLAVSGVIPVMVAPDIELFLTYLDSNELYKNRVIVDARMAKRNIDTRMDQAPLVIGLGPGFNAGVDCHAVIETNRGHRLGRVIWSGAAEPNTGSPGIVQGKGRERVLRAAADGPVSWRKEIGDRVHSGELLGEVAGEPVIAPFDGVVRGLILPGSQVPSGLKIGDIDPRDDIDMCYTISEKALAIGGGVLESILVYLHRHFEE